MWSELLIRFAAHLEVRNVVFTLSLFHGQLTSLNIWVKSLFVSAPPPPLSLISKTPTFVFFISSVDGIKPTERRRFSSNCEQEEQRGTGEVRGGVSSGSQCCSSFTLTSEKRSSRSPSLLWYSWAELSCAPDATSWRSESYLKSSTINQMRRLNLQIIHFLHIHSVDTGFK